MKNVDDKLSEILTQAIADSQIIGFFQLGHNVFQSTAQINEIFAMLDGVIDKIMTVIGDIIPDINLAPYKDGYVDSSRVNLCWIELLPNYYGLILNTHKGIKYRKFDQYDMQNLLLNGQTSSWYLVSKIQNLAYILASNKSESDFSSTLFYFKRLIIDIIERFLSEHENSSKYHPAGLVTIDNLESIISRLQIQNTSTIIPSSTVENSSTNGIWSTSQIKTDSNGKQIIITWQSSSNIVLRKVTPELAQTIMSSKYLNSRADIEAFLTETHEKLKQSTSNLNEFCFIAQDEFTFPYYDLNYVVESQLRGYIEIKYKNGDVEKIYPDTQPILIEKGKNNIAFMIIVKLNNDINKKIDDVVLDVATKSYLPDIRLVCSVTGISEVN